MAIAAIPIQAVSTVSGNQFRANRIIEADAQTFLAGVPVQIENTGAIIVWDVSVGAGHLIAGVSYEDAHNLASDGLGAPLPGQPVVGVGASLTFGSVPNETSAVNIPHGAPFVDGRVGLYYANSDTVFSAMFGNNGSKATPAITDLGLTYGMTLDSNSKYFYVDKNKTGGSAVLTVVGLDPRDTPAAGSRVLFQFIAADTAVLA